MRIDIFNDFYHNMCDHGRCGSFFRKRLEVTLTVGSIFDDWVRVRVTSDHQKRYFRPTQKDTSNHQSYFQPFTETYLRRHNMCDHGHHFLLLSLLLLLCTIFSIKRHFKLKHFLNFPMKPFVFLKGEKNQLLGLGTMFCVMNLETKLWLEMTGKDVVYMLRLGTRVSFIG